MVRCRLLRIGVTCAVAFFSFPTQGASRQPLSCDDMVLLNPGLTCKVFAPFSSDEDNPLFERAEGHGVAFDNEGNLLLVRERTAEGEKYSRIEIVAYGEAGPRVIAYIQGVQRDGQSIWREHITTHDKDGALLFDAVHGRLLVWLQSQCRNLNRKVAGCDSSYGGMWIAAIEGFAPLADILPDSGGRLTP